MLSPDGLVNVHAYPNYPEPVLRAFNRTCDIVSRCSAFVDRVPAIAEAIDEVIAWRWAGLITEEQQVHLFGQLRVYCLDPGSAVLSGTQSAIELDTWEAERADSQAA